MVSEAAPCGSVQVPPDGQPILLMADCQTTGGYPVIGVVIDADLPLVAQLAPSDALTFAAVELEEAHRLLRTQEKVLWEAFMD